MNGKFEWLGGILDLGWLSFTGGKGGGGRVPWCQSKPCS